MAFRKIVGPPGIPGRVNCRRIPGRSVARQFTAKDVGRIVCGAIERGLLKESVQNEIKECVDFDDPACEKEKEKLQEAVKKGLEAIEASSIVLERAALIASVVTAALLVGVRLARFLPGFTKGVAIPLQVAQRAALQTEGFITAQLAANVAARAFLANLLRTGAQLARTTVTL